MSGILCSTACSICTAFCLVSSTGDQRKGFSQLTLQELRGCRVTEILRQGLTLDQSAASAGLQEIL